MSYATPPATDAPPQPPGARAPGERRVPRPVAVAIFVAATILGLIVVGLAVRLDPDRLPTGPPLPPPTPTPVGLQFDPATREASYANVEVTLADAPYVCADKPEPYGPFEEDLPCSFTVHQSYSESSSWTADTGLALAPASLAVADDTEATAKAMFAKTLETAYPPGAKVTKLDVGPYAAASDSAVLSAHVNVSIPKLPTTYDVVVIVVLPADDGQQVVFYSYKPNDAGDQALKALQDSARTLTS